MSTVGQIFEKSSLFCGFILFLCLLVVGCNNGRVDGLSERPSAVAHQFPTIKPSLYPYEISNAFGSQKFNLVIGLTFAPDGSGRLYTLQLDGSQGVRMLESKEATSSTVFFNLNQVTEPTLTGDTMVGVAFDPNYATNRYVFVAYLDGNERLVIARYTAKPDGSEVDVSTGKLILEVENPEEGEFFHYAGDIKFGPDGMLYIPVGDGGPIGDPNRRGQSLDDVYGNVLRIDPNSGDPYAIPPDNPFVGQGGGVREEIWAYGLRHPFRISFDSLTGDLWTGDVGDVQQEEVDIVVKGGNYGWSFFEGDATLNDPGTVSFDDFIPPVLNYTRENNDRCVIGGHVYRSSRVPSLAGAYIYGDCASGRIWALRYDGEQVVSNTEIANIPGITGFGLDADGEVYAASRSSDTLYQFNEVALENQLVAIPPTLSATGLFSDTAALKPATGLIEYDVNSPLWSDDAIKKRWIALPEGGEITFSDTDAWEFPVGTILVKHFELATDLVTIRRLETRVLVLFEDGWGGYTYKWDENELDADLVEQAEEETYYLNFPGVMGGPRFQTWYYPNTSDCFRCHTDAAGIVLGVRTRQLNGDFNFPLALANQLETWSAIGLFDVELDVASSYATYPSLDDDSASWEARSKAYLDVNCAHCHQPAGPAPAAFDLRFDTPLADMGVLGAEPMFDDFGLESPRIIAPGDSANSVLFHRMAITTAGRMPALATSIVDEEAVELLSNWIDSL